MKAGETFRIVLDVNVIISGLINPSGVPGLILREIMSDAASLRLIVSRAVLDELQAVIAYPSVKRYLKVDESKIRNLLVDFELVAELHDTAGHSIDMHSSDSDDDKYLLLAEAAKPDFLVSGDEHLTVLKTIGGVAILSPREFWNLFQKRSSVH